MTLFFLQLISHVRIIINQFKKHSMRPLLFQLLTTGVVATNLVSCAEKGNPKVENTKPNVIILLTDDQGYGDLACTGNPY